MPGSRTLGSEAVRIAWISYGFGEYSVRQANALAADNQVLLVQDTRSVGPYTGLVDPHVQGHFFDRARLRQPCRQARSIRNIISTVRQFSPDVIHYQGGHFWFNLALPLLREYPLVVTIHDPRHHEGDVESRKTPQRLMDFGYRRADRVIVHGRRHVEVVHREIGIPSDRIHVLPHVALGTADAGVARGVEEDARNILFFGRIWGYKGLEYLIYAEPIISREVPDVCITIAGEGEDFDRYRRLMRDPARFEVHNSWVSDDERARLFQRAAVVVLPYTSASQSGVIPIAFSHAKPVVATHVGALPEYVDDGRNGILVPPRDEVALAEAIVFLLKNHQQRREMGKDGRQKLRDEWSPDVVARSTVEVYRCAVRDRRARGPVYGTRQG
jgi:glycosyltransferase involved in cell wall biosynthesis